MMDDHILDSLKALRRSVKDVTTLDETFRQKAYKEARALMLELESDADTLVRLHFGMFEAIALDTAHRMGLLEALASAQSPQTSSDLATALSKDVLLTDRVLRCLAAWGCIDSQSTPQDAVYLANHVTRLTTTNRGSLHMKWMHGTLHAGMIEIPNKLAANDFRSLTAGVNTVFNDLRRKPDVNLWQLLSPEEIQAFKTFMPTFNIESVDWLKHYPAQERLIAGAKSDKDAALFVDVGGNTGYQAAAFRKHFSDAPGRVILQDLPHIVANAVPGIEAMPHDFFTAQPVRGSRAYYFRFIMHDWSDENNVKILSSIRNAMEPGYSRVLIHDWILPDHDASMLMTSMDLCMMATFGGEERSLSRHKRYLEAAGLCVSGVWDLKDGRSQAIIECERV